MCILMKYRCRLSPPFLALATMLCSSTQLARANSSDNAFVTFGNVAQIALPLWATLETITHKDYPGAVEFGKVFGVTMAAVYILKPLVNETRPNGGAHSFPSGHTASAFAGAGFLQRRYGWSYGLPAYVAAALTGVSRVEGNYHWSADVLTGALIGFSANLLFTKKFAPTVTLAPLPRSTLDSKAKVVGLQISTPF